MGRCRRRVIRFLSRAQIFGGFEMIPLVIGILIVLFGAFTVANAAFSARAQMGFSVCLVGAVIAVGGLVEVVAGWLA